MSCAESNQPTPTLSDDVGTFERLFNGIAYRKITISITGENWELMNQNMLDHQAQYGNLKTDEYVLAHMTYEDEEGLLNIENIGLRPRGNLSLVPLMDEENNINMNHFKISFREEFDGQHPENDGRRGFDLKELNMKWNRTFDDTYYTEPFALGMMNHYSVYAPHTTHFILSLVIDDVETIMGLYIGIEPIDDEFIERRFSKEENDGDLYKCLWQQFGPATLEPITNMAAIGIRDIATNYMPTYDLKTNKDSSDHLELLSFIDNINTLDDLSFNTYLNLHFDIDMFLTYLAINAFIGNPDDYRAMGNNYYMYQNSDTGIWMMLPYDFDHGLGQGWFESGAYPNYTIGVDIFEWFELNDYISGLVYQEPLVDKLLSQTGYKYAYASIISNILNDDYFTFEYFYEQYSQLKDAFQGTFDYALDAQDFGLRDVENYIQSKRADILAQLNDFN